MNEFVDPAMHESANTDAFIRLKDLTIDPEAVYVFDFDGVMTSRLEDDVYKLKQNDDELFLIANAANYFNIMCAEMDQQYQRHLVYQAAALKLRMPIEKGPGFELARTACEKARLFVLTARSGWHAIERCRNFLRQHDILPIETYHVGRVAKDRQIELLVGEFPDRTIYYVEDSSAHLESLAQRRIGNLSLVFSQKPESRLSVAELRRHFVETLNRALAS